MGRQAFGKSVRAIVPRKPALYKCFQTRLCNGVPLGRLSARPRRSSERRNLVANHGSQSATRNGKGAFHGGWVAIALSVVVDRASFSSRPAVHHQSRRRSALFEVAWIFQLVRCSKQPGSPTAFLTGFILVWPVDYGKRLSRLRCVAGPFALAALMICVGASVIAPLMSCTFLVGSSRGCFTFIICGYSCWLASMALFLSLCMVQFMSRRVNRAETASRGEFSSHSVSAGHEALPQLPSASRPRPGTDSQRRTRRPGCPS